MNPDTFQKYKIAIDILIYIKRLQKMRKTGEGSFKYHVFDYPGYQAKFLKFLSSDNDYKRTFLFLH
jgi:hypothetical protein